MKIPQTILSTLVSGLAAVSACAQEPKVPAEKGAAGPADTAQAPPATKLAQHDVLQQFVGSWDVTMRAEALPGVEGMEKATESAGTEHGELLNNGMWLKSTIDAVHAGKPFHGIWLVGYDPHAKEYVGAWVCSDANDPNLTTMTGAYDEAKKTWTWSGKTPHGDMRSVVVASDPDTIVETCFLKGEDGKEHKAAEITRKRSARTAAPAAEASAGTAAKLPAEVAAMAGDVGSWQASVRCSGAPGQPEMEAEGIERVTPVAGGKWLWVDFAGRFQGQPYEGHGLTGYDASEKKVVSIWVDSMSPTWCRTTGAPVGDDAELVLEGTCVDPAGRKQTVVQRLTRTGDSRTMKMEAKGAAGTSTMTITYRRKDG